MGRPLLTPEARRDWCHSIYFYENEYRAVARIAVRKGVAISKFIREAVKEKLEKEAKP